MVRNNYRLIFKYIAGRWGNLTDGEDLLQEGAIALQIAILRFNPDLGYKLSTYLHGWLLQRVGEAVTMRGTPMGIRRGKLQAYLTAMRLGEHFKHEDDIARAISVGSLDVPVSTDSSNAPTHLDLLPSRMDSIEEVLQVESDQAYLRHMVDTILTDRERHIVRLYYGFETGESMSLEQIRRHEPDPISKQRLQQILSRAIGKLRDRASVSGQFKSRFEGRKLDKPPKVSLRGSAGV